MAALRWKFAVESALLEDILARFRDMTSGRVGAARPVLTISERELMGEAQRWIRRNLDAPLKIPQLAHELGVSDRWIRSCFRAALGIGPYRCALLQKLQSVRGDLQQGPAGPRAVTIAAQRHGFQNLSRFAEQYRSHFGENPSATLGRSR